MNDKKYLLSICIPSRNEMFLARTIEDILEHKSPDTEIIVGLDGEWAMPPIKDHPDVTIVHVSESWGQRKMINQLCALSRAKFIMKTDAHVAFDQGFDVKMLKAFEEEGDEVVMAPIMRNLHVFNWVCPEGHRRYQGQSGDCIICLNCGGNVDDKKKRNSCNCDNRQVCGKETVKEVVWIPKPSPMSTAYRFDTTSHFQYFGEYKKRPEYNEAKDKNGRTESMNLQGSCFMMTRKNYVELNIDDERMGSWGNQAFVVSCKFWLSGRRVLINHNTWYAHLFRTAGGDFGFPYPNPQKKIDEGKKISRDLFFENKWEKQTKPLSWLIERFKPLPDWHDDTPESKEALAKINKAGMEFLTKNGKKSALSLAEPMNCRDA